jgi:hypothetical protein
MSPRNIILNKLIKKLYLKFDSAITKSLRTAEVRHDLPDIVKICSKIIQTFPGLKYQRGKKVKFRFTTKLKK